MLCSRYRTKSIFEISQHPGEDSVLPDFTSALAAKVLSNLGADSATGPDLLPAQLLKICAKELAIPLSILVKRIIETGIWPDLWREHWIIALHKRKAASDAKNYRGIHLTAHLSKAAERMLKHLAAPQLQCPLRVGAYQFVYCQGRGSRDALAFLVMSWIMTFERKKKVALF